jgi:GntR family transcriptional regulator
LYRLVRMSRHTIPRHQAIERHLRSRIANLNAGDPVESDAELCALFQVSRMTVRQAAQRLADEGLIYRVPGVGTFVAELKVHRDVGRLRSFTEEKALRGAVASSRLLIAEIRSGSQEEITVLQLPPRAKVAHVRRLRLADRKPMAIEDVVLPDSCAAVLNEDLENGSLHEALQRLGEIPTRAVGTQVAALANPDDAKLLSIKRNAALLIERRLITNQNGLPLEKTETRYVGDGFVFDIVLSR